MARKKSKLDPSFLFIFIVLLIAPITFVEFLHLGTASFSIMEVAAYEHVIEENVNQNGSEEEQQNEAPIYIGTNHDGYIRITDEAHVEELSSLAFMLIPSVEEESLSWTVSLGDEGNSPHFFTYDSSSRHLELPDDRLTNHQLTNNENELSFGSIPLISGEPRMFRLMNPSDSVDRNLIETEVYFNGPRLSWSHGETARNFVGSRKVEITLFGESSVDAIKDRNWSNVFNPQQHTPLCLRQDAQETLSGVSRMLGSGRWIPIFMSSPTRVGTDWEIYPSEQFSDSNRPNWCVANTENELIEECSENLEIGLEIGDTNWVVAECPSAPNRSVLRISELSDDEELIHTEWIVPAFHNGEIVIAGGLLVRAGADFSVRPIAEHIDNQTGSWVQLLDENDENDESFRSELELPNEQLLFTLGESGSRSVYALELPSSEEYLDPEEISTIRVVPFPGKVLPQQRSARDAIFNALDPILFSFLPEFIIIPKPRGELQGNYHAPLGLQCEVQNNMLTTCDGNEVSNSSSLGVDPREGNYYQAESGIVRIRNLPIEGGFWKNGPQMWIVWTGWMILLFGMTLLQINKTKNKAINKTKRKIELSWFGAFRVAALLLILQFFAMMGVTQIAELSISPLGLNSTIPLSRQMQGYIAAMMLVPHAFEFIQFFRAKITNTKYKRILSDTVLFAGLSGGLALFIANFLHLPPFLELAAFPLGFAVLLFLPKSTTSIFGWLSVIPALVGSLLMIKLTTLMSLAQNPIKLLILIGILFAVSVIGIFSLKFFIQIVQWITTKIFKKRIFLARVIDSVFLSVFVAAIVSIITRVQVSLGTAIGNLIFVQMLVLWLVSEASRIKIASKVAKAVPLNQSERNNARKWNQLLAFHWGIISAVYFVLVAGMGGDFGPVLARGTSWLFALIISILVIPSKRKAITPKQKKEIEKFIFMIVPVFLFMALSPFITNFNHMVSQKVGSTFGKFLLLLEIVIAILWVGNMILSSLKLNTSKKKNDQMPHFKRNLIGIIVLLIFSSSLFWFSSAHSVQNMGNGTGFIAKIFGMWNQRSLCASEGSLWGFCYQLTIAAYQAQETAQQVGIDIMLPSSHSDLAIIRFVHLGKYWSLFLLPPVALFIGTDLFIWRKRKTKRSEQVQLLQPISVVVAFVFISSALLHVYGATARMPMTGVPFPFLSLGPTELLAALLSLVTILAWTNVKRAEQPAFLGSAILGILTVVLLLTAWIPPSIDVTRSSDLLELSDSDVNADLENACLNENTSSDYAADQFLAHGDLRQLNNAGLETEDENELVGWHIRNQIEDIFICGDPSCHINTRVNMERQTVNNQTDEIGENTTLPIRAESDGNGNLCLTSAPGWSYRENEDENPRFQLERVEPPRNNDRPERLATELYLGTWELTQAGFLQSSQTSNGNNIITITPQNGMTVCTEDLSTNCVNGLSLIGISAIVDNENALYRELHREFESLTDDITAMLAHSPEEQDVILRDQFILDSDELNGPAASAFIYPASVPIGHQTSLFDAYRINENTAVEVFLCGEESYYARKNESFSYDLSNGEYKEDDDCNDQFCIITDSTSFLNIEYNDVDERNREIGWYTINTAGQCDQIQEYCHPASSNNHYQQLHENTEITTQPTILCGTEEEPLLSVRLIDVSETSNQSHTALTCGGNSVNRHQWETISLTPLATFENSDFDPESDLQTRLNAVLDDWIYQNSSVSLASATLINYNTSEILALSERRPVGRHASEIPAFFRSNLPILSTWKLLVALRWRQFMIEQHERDQNSEEERREQWPSFEHFAPDWHDDFQLTEANHPEGISNIDLITALGISSNMYFHNLHHDLVNQRLENELQETDEDGDYRTLLERLNRQFLQNEGAEGRYQWAVPYGVWIDDRHGPLGTESSALSPLVETANLLGVSALPAHGRMERMPSWDRVNTQHRMSELLPYQWSSGILNAQLISTAEAYSNSNAINPLAHWSVGLHVLITPWQMASIYASFARLLANENSENNENNGFELVRFQRRQEERGEFEQMLDPLFQEGYFITVETEETEEVAETEEVEEEPLLLEIFPLNDIANGLAAVFEPWGTAKSDSFLSNVARGLPINDQVRSTRWLGKTGSEDRDITNESVYQFVAFMDPTDSGGGEHYLIWITVFDDGGFMESFPHISLMSDLIREFTKTTVENLE